MNHTLRAGRLMTKAFWQTAARRLARGPLQPSWSFQFEVVISFLKADNQTLWRLEAPEIRAYLDSLTGSKAMVKKCQIKPETINGVPGEWFIPPTTTPNAAIIYYHGGSYIFGSTKTHGDVLARYALYSGLPVFAPLYRLAPEHPWPAPLEDALAVFDGLPQTQIALAGESAGGHLVLSLSRALHQRREKIPTATVAVSPWLDMLAQSDSYERNLAYDYGTREMLLHQAKLVAGTNSPESFSLMEDIHERGPLLLQAGGAELLHDEIASFANKMKAAGHAAELDVLPEMPHAASNLAAFCPQGDQAVRRACDFIKNNL